MFNIFNFLFPPLHPLPPHRPARRWCVPLDWYWKPEVSYTVTAFIEDLPSKCFNCGSDTEFEDLDPMYIEGNLQFMKRVCFCPNGCGFTVWIA